jgi:hypothetical protein
MFCATAKFKIFTNRMSVTLLHRFLFSSFFILSTNTVVSVAWLFDCIGRLSSWSHSQIFSIDSTFLDLVSWLSSTVHNLHLTITNGQRKYSCKEKACVLLLPVHILSLNMICTVPSFSVNPVCSVRLVLDPAWIRLTWFDNEEWSLFSLSLLFSLFTLYSCVIRTRAYLKRTGSVKIGFSSMI